MAADDPNVLASPDLFSALTARNRSTESAGHSSSTASGESEGSEQREAAGEFDLFALLASPRVSGDFGAVGVATPTDPFQLTAPADGDALWLDLDDDLTLDDDPLFSDPLAEVDALLEQAGLSSGRDFRDVLEFLHADLCTPDLLCRCLPGLARVWDHYRQLIADALRASGKDLVTDITPMLTQLLRDDSVPSLAGEAVPLDALHQFLGEVSAQRLLSREEQRLLGLWVVDGRLIERVEAALPSSRSRAGDSAELVAYLHDELATHWGTVLAALARIPTSAAGWRAALTTLAWGCVDHTHIGAVAARLHVTDEDARDSARRVETVLRLWPGEAFVRFTDHLTGKGKAEDAPLLDGAEGAAAVTAYKERAQAAKQATVRHNLRLVVSVARNYAPTTTCLELNDLIQEVALGLMRAIDKWDPARGYTFSTYAIWWIKQAIHRAIADKGLVVRLPVRMQEKIQPALQQACLGARLSREERLLPADQAEPLLQLSRSERARAERFALLSAMDFALDVAAQLSGLLDVESIEESDPAVMQSVSDDECLAEVEQRERRSMIDTALAGLSPRENLVLRRHFGLDGDRDSTLEAVGREFGVTRERIRQIEAKAIRRLRRPSRLKLFTGYEDDTKQRYARHRLDDPRSNRSPHAAERLEAVREAVRAELNLRVSRLPEAVGAVLRLRLGLVDGTARSQAEVARQLNIAQGFVRWREADGVHALHDLLVVQGDSVSLRCDARPPAANKTPAQGMPTVGMDGRSMSPAGVETEDASQPTRSVLHDVRRGLQGLPKRQREVIELRPGLVQWQEYWSLGDVSRYLSLPVEEVQSLEREAVLQLRDLVEICDGVPRIKTERADVAGNHDR